MTAYATTHAPHIRAAESVPKMMWKTVAALLPAVLVALFFFRANALVLIVTSCLSCALAEVLGRMVFKRKLVTDGRGAVVGTVVTGLIFSLLLPPTTPVWMAAAGGFIAIFFGREIEGGLGANHFNPALVGLAFLHVGFPEAMNRTPAMTETLPLLSLAAGGLFLILQKLIRWEIPVLYLLIRFFSSAFAEENFVPGLLSGTMALFAFFVITDPVTTPLTREGCRIFAVTSAVLAAVLSRWLPSATTAALPSATTAALPSATTAALPSGAAAAVFSVLLMNGAVPWIDRKIRPRGAHRKEER